MKIQDLSKEMQTTIAFWEQTELSPASKQLKHHNYIPLSSSKTLSPLKNPMQWMDSQFYHPKMFPNQVFHAFYGENVFMINPQ